MLRDGGGVRRAVKAEYRLVDLLLGEGLGGVGGEMGADGILASGQVQRFLPAVDGPLLQIKVQPAAADAAAGRPGLPPQVSGHPGPQLRDAEGLGQVVVPAQPPGR